MNLILLLNPLSNGINNCILATNKNCAAITVIAVWINTLKSGHSFDHNFFIINYIKKVKYEPYITVLSSFQWY